MNETSTKQPLTAAALQRDINTPPFHKFLNIGVESVDAENGVVTLRLPFQAAFCRSPDVLQIHGGVTSAFVDITGDYALVAVLGYGVPTINLRLDFLRMAENTDLVAVAKVIKAGRTIGVVDITVTDDNDRLIAIGRGNYSTRAG